MEKLILYNTFYLKSTVSSFKVIKHSIITNPWQIEGTWLWWPHQTTSTLSRTTVPACWWLRTWCIY